MRARGTLGAATALAAVVALMIPSGGSAALGDGLSQCAFDGYIVQASNGRFGTFDFQDNTAGIPNAMVCAGSAVGDTDINFKKCGTDVPYDNPALPDSQKRCTRGGHAFKKGEVIGFFNNNWIDLSINDQAESALGGQFYAEFKTEGLGFSVSGHDCSGTVDSDRSPAPLTTTGRKGVVVTGNFTMSCTGGSIPPANFTARGVFITTFIPDPADVLTFDQTKIGRHAYIAGTATFADGVPAVPDWPA